MHGLLLIGAVLVAATPYAASAQPGFGSGPTVRGVAIEIDARGVWAEPDLFTAERLCGAVRSSQDELRTRLDRYIGDLNSQIGARVPGVQLVRYGLVPSATCRVVATYLPRGVIVTATLSGNRFVTNLTTPGTTFGPIDVGLPQGADPRLSVTFDVKATTQLALPERPGACVTRGPEDVHVENVSPPRGENFTGRMVGWLAEAAFNISSFMNNPELARLLGESLVDGEAVPRDMIDRINVPLCRSGQAFGSIQQGLRGDQLVLGLGRGAAIVDDRCIDGYVWRIVNPSDRVCVRPAIAAQVREDNRLAPERRVPVLNLPNCPRAMPDCVRTPRPGGVQCRSGFVWRAAVENDTVCVLPATRDQAREDNRLAPTRRRDYREPIH